MTCCFVVVIVLVFKVTEDGVLDVVDKVLQTPQSSLVTKEYAINAVMKLSTRYY